MKSLAPIALVLLSFGCDDGDKPDDTAQLGLPAAFRMTGEGSLDLPDGGIVECSLDLVFELREEVARDRKTVSYKGIHGGGMYRSVRAADDSGTTFWIDVFGDVEASLTFPDALELVIPINVNTGSRFYDNFHELRGTMHTPKTGSGTWTCAPLDTDQDGHPDREHTVQGTWTIEEIIIEPEPPEEEEPFTQVN